MKNPELLTKRFEKNIAGVLSCFDRLVLFGTYQPMWCSNPAVFYLYCMKSWCVQPPSKSNVATFMVFLVDACRLSPLRKSAIGFKH